MDFWLEFLLGLPKGATPEGLGRVKVILQPARSLNSKVRLDGPLSTCVMQITEVWLGLSGQAHGTC